MRRCLTDDEVWRVAEGNASTTLTAHELTCRDCHARISAVRDDLGTLARAVSHLPGPPPALAGRIEALVEATDERRGATTLVAAVDDRRRRRWAWPGVGAAVSAAAAGLLWSLLPQANLSASEILLRTRSALSDQQGVETSEYELDLDGAAMRLSGFAEGRQRIEQVVDYSHAGRYRVASYGPGGTLLGVVAQDPVTRQRTGRMWLDGMGYYVRFSLAEGPAGGVPEMLRGLMEGVITMMQSSADVRLNVMTRPDGRHYQIDIPPMATARPSAVWDLAGARVVVDGMRFGRRGVRCERHPLRRSDARVIPSAASRPPTGG